jgi:hypothetical protein
MSAAPNDATARLVLCVSSLGAFNPARSPAQLWAGPGPQLSPHELSKLDTSGASLVRKKSNRRGQFVLLCV